MQANLWTTQPVAFPIRLPVRARVPSLDPRWRRIEAQRPFPARRHYWFGYADIHPLNTVDDQDGVLELEVRVSGGARLDVRLVNVAPQYDVWR